MMLDFENAKPMMEYIGIADAIQHFSYWYWMPEQILFEPYLLSEQTLETYHINRAVARIEQ